MKTNRPPLTKAQRAAWCLAQAAKLDEQAAWLEQEERPTDWRERRQREDAITNLRGEAGRFRASALRLQPGLAFPTAA